MTLAEFRLLTDENIDPKVVEYLRQMGFDVADVCERREQGSADAALLATAVAEQRVVLTHDADFGRLAVAERKELVGILYLRPGHIDSQFTIETIKVLLKGQFQVTAPFVMVAKRSGDLVTVRTRLLSNS